MDTQKVVITLKKWTVSPWFPLLGTIVIVIIVSCVVAISGSSAKRALPAYERVSDSFVTDMQQDNPRAADALFPSGQPTSAEGVLTHYLSVDSPLLQGNAQVSGALQDPTTKAVVIYAITKSGQTVYLKTILTQSTSRAVSTWYMTGFQPWKDKPKLNDSLSD